MGQQVRPSALNTKHSKQHQQQQAGWHGEIDIEISPVKFDRCPMAANGVAGVHGLRIPKTCLSGPQFAIKVKLEESTQVY
ncbi:hypothetical protein [Oryza sativa Japonica Group]|uniref:Uncharacterized protein P0034C09.40 n=1 Tax=Oryza sativa subsp. japonica TaxID=39947 RepID=Q5N7Q2_ORYSJ|nr:hypothetical protein [Oryza sativa Japonica Group]